MKCKRILSLALTLAMLLTMVSVSAALPTTNGSIDTPYELTLKNLYYTKSGTAGTYSTVSDDTFGTVHRYTTASGSTRSEFAFDFGLDTTAPNILAGEYVYVSFYYRLNSAATDANVTEALSKFWVYMVMESNSGTTMDQTGEADTWHRFEQVVTTNARDWSNIRMYGGVPSDYQIHSFDIAGARALYLGAATEEADKTILQQVQETFSDDSSISAISIGSTSIDLAANPYYYSLVGDVDSIVETVSVTPTDDGAKVIVSKLDDATCLIRVYAECADLVNPASSHYTEYVIECIEPTLTIPVNEGKGTKLAFDFIYPVESVDTRSWVDNDVFGEAIRYTSTYIDQYKWPKFSMNFNFAEATATGANDYAYISFYWRNNTAAEESAVTDTLNYFNRFGVAGSNAAGDSITIAKVDTADAPNPGEWHFEEYLLKLGAAQDARTSIDQRFQYGVLSGLTDGSATISIDFANPVCYYLGEVTYYDGATDAAFEAATIAALRSTFGTDKSISAISLDGDEIDLAANPASYDVIGSSANVAKGYGATKTLTTPNLFVTTADPNAYVAVRKTSDALTEICVFAPGEDILTAAPTTYSITNSICLAAPILKKDGTEVTDYTALTAGSYTAEISAANTSGEAFTGIGILAAYNASGMLVGIGTASLDMADGASETKTISMTTTDTAASMKLLTWDGLSSVAPLMADTIVDAKGIH